MHIITPSEIKSVAWGGELIPPSTTYAIHSFKRPIVTIGQPEIWPVAEALENQVGQKWVAPLGNASYWLLRLACTLREPQGLPTIAEAQQMLNLHPKNSRADERTAYAYSLFPERLSVEDKVEFSITLGPALKFADGSEFNVGQLGAKIEYRKVFPVIQSYGAGESAPYWIFKPHSTRPLDGSQFVYAVVVARAGAGGVSADVEVAVTVEQELFGRIRLGLPEQAKACTRFTIP